MTVDPSCPRAPRRRVVGGFLGAAAAGLGGRDARAARGIAIAAPGEWLQGAFETALLGPFKKARPDVNVLFYGVGNALQILSTLRSERYAPTLDVVLLDPLTTARAMGEGLLEPLDPAVLPTTRNLPEAEVPKRPYVPIAMWDSLAIGYNPGLVPIPPRSWRDLWNGRADRLALQMPPEASAMALTEIAGMMFGGQAEQKSLEAGMTALAALAPRIAVRDPIPDVTEAITQGDAAIGPVWNARAQYMAPRSRGRFAVVLPEEGSPVVPTTLNLVKGGRQQDAAMALLTWLLSPEAQRLIAEALYFSPVTTADLSESALARVGATPAMIARRMPMGWADNPSVRAQIAQEWRQRGLTVR